MRLPPLYQRLFLVLAILFALAVPTAFLVWRSQHRTAADFAKEAEQLRAEGNAEQAQLSMDRALDMAESGDERVEILQSLLKEQQSVQPTTPAEGMASLITIASSQMRILHDESTNQEAANEVMAFHAAMFRTVGASIVDGNVIEFQLNLIRGTNPTHEDAAEVALRRQLALWRQQPRGAVTTSVVEERLAPIRFILQRRLLLALDIYFFLRQEAAASRGEPDEFEEMAAAVLREYAGGEPGSQRLLEVLAELQAGDSATANSIAEVALAEAQNLTTGAVAMAWLSLLTTDRRLVWNDGILVHRGHLQAKLFLERLPAGLVDGPELASRRLDVLWNLNDPELAVAIERAIARAEATVAPALDSISIWATASSAGRLLAESILQDGTSGKTKLEKLDALAGRLDGMLGAQPVLERIEVLKLLAKGWYHSALPQLTTTAERGDPYAGFWAAQVLEMTAAPDAAYRMRLQIAQGVVMQIPARFHWENLMGLVRADLARNQNGAGRQALAQFAASGESKVMAEVRAAVSILDLLRSAPYADQDTVRASLALIEAPDEVGLAAVCRATVLLELRAKAEGLQILREVPLTRETVGLWPGVEAGHVEAWGLLASRLLAATEARGGIAAEFAAILEARDLPGREELMALQQLLDGDDPGRTFFRIGRHFVNRGRLDDSEALLALWDKVDSESRGRAMFDVQLALARNQRELATSQLAELESSAEIDPVELGHLRARLAMLDGDLSEARTLVDEQLRICGTHVGLLALKGALAEKAGDEDALGEAKDAYRKILQMDRRSNTALAGLYRVRLATGDKQGAAKLLALISASRGQIPDLAALQAASGDTKLDVGAIVDSFLEARRNGALSPTIEAQLIAFLWRLDRQDEARAIAGELIPKLRDRLPLLLTALAVVGDPVAAQELDGYLERKKGDVTSAEFLAIGRFWDLRGRHSAAELAFRRMTSEATRKQYGAWLLRRRRPADAVTVLEPLWSAKSGSEVGLLLADAYHALGKTDSAMTVLQQIEKAGQVVNRLPLAKAQLLQHTQPAEAEKLVETYVAANPLDPWGYLARAKLHFRDAKAAARVVGDLEKAIELAPAFSEARMMLADWKLRHGDAGGAVSLLQEGGDRSPASMRVKAAELLSRLENLEVDAASRSADELLARFPRVALAQRVAMHAYVTTGHYGKALPLVEEFIRDQPDSIVDLNNGAHLLAVTGTDSDRALQYTNRAIAAAGPNSPYLPYLMDTRALVLTFQGDFEEVLSSSRVQGATYRPAHMLYVATALAALGKPEEAEQLVEKLLAGEQSQAPDWYSGLADLGMVAPPAAAKVLLRVLQPASSRAEVDTGNSEIAAKLFAAVARLQDLAESPRAAVVMSLRTSAGLAPNPWAAVMQVKLARDSGGNEQAFAEAVRNAEEALAARPLPYLRRWLQELADSK